MVVVTAPTGVAAINAGGATIHSTMKVFGMYPRRKPVRSQKVNWNSVDVLIIDEISMVGPDLLDQVDHILRSSKKYHLPFGGIQVLLVGDAGQLKPVYNPYTEAEKKDYVDLQKLYGPVLTFDKAKSFI